MADLFEPCSQVGALRTTSGKQVHEEKLAHRRPTRTPDKQNVGSNKGCHHQHCRGLLLMTKLRKPQKFAFPPSPKCSFNNVQTPLSVRSQNLIWGFSKVANDTRFPQVKIILSLLEKTFDLGSLRNVWIQHQRLRQSLFCLCHISVFGMSHT